MWHTTIETSLNVPFDSIEKLYPYIDEYIIDIKDMNPIIYESYTGKDNKFVLSNLSKMLKDGMEPKMKCRVPFIPGYNNSDDQEHSFAELIDIGVTRIEKFDYLKKENSYERKRKM
jgi:pyruvate formate lyase activating enzyme